MSVSGFRNFTSGSYSVAVDDVKSVYNAQSSFLQPTTLFYMAGLGTDIVHNLTVINLENRMLAIGSINVATVNIKQR